MARAGRVSAQRQGPERAARLGLKRLHALLCRASCLHGKLR